ncbi:transcription factor EC isoform X2 [Lingula anatina]|uniref:Transcription factor EC isoform X2 n=1 Tax=Lingula anatina TaxID=7574 RepID=A0A2R2MS32_LINAN|nr:transcription factor EC isoform X2 [Lingula anatina]|eukprot:XP_023933071.1 transcription factor EC isoform X2 [Lingula anatina]
MKTTGQAPRSLLEQYLRPSRSIISDRTRKLLQTCRENNNYITSKMPGIDKSPKSHRGPSSRSKTVIVVTKGNHVLLRSLLKPQEKTPSEKENDSMPSSSDSDRDDSESEKSPPTEVKNAHVSTRANMKQLIMKQQLQDLDRKELQYSQSLPSRSEQSSAINMPDSGSTTTEVPPQVLQVKTRLENPTRYYVQQTQKRQIQSYITHSKDDLGTHSMPAMTHHYDTGHQLHSSSMPVAPDSPLSVGVSSTCTSVSEADDILGDFLNLEAVDPSMDSDLNFIEPTLTQMSSTVPHFNYTHEYYGATGTTARGKSSSSCPADILVKKETPGYLNEDEARMWAKERQKKDNHNLIERRRRFNINDRIKELGTLLPKGCDPEKDMRQNKGTILKASVDYIRKLRKDHEKLKMMEERHRSLESTNRKMMLRIQQLELMMKSHGISNPALSQSNAQLLGDVIKQSQLPLQIKQEPVEQGGCMSMNGAAPMMGIEDMDDVSPVSGDPMLSSSPTGSRRSSFSLDEQDSHDYMG